MGIKFSNLASTTLSSGISSSATSISVTSASEFPTIGAGDYFYASIGFGDGSEIVKVTSVSGSTFTVVRGQDGSTAAAWSAADPIALRVVAAALEDLRDAADTESVSISGDTMTGNLKLSDGTEFQLGDSNEFKIKHHASGYTHLENTVGTLYIDSDSVTFRDDDGSPTNVLINQSGIDVTGTIASGAITSTGIITSADFFKATGQNIKFSAGGTHVLNMDVNRKIYPNTNNSTDLGHSGTLAFRTLYLTNSIYHNTALILDGSRNLTNIGTIASGAITLVGSSGTSVVESIRNPSTSWSQYALTRYGTEGADTRYMDIGYYRGSDEGTRGFVIKSQSGGTLVTVLDSGDVLMGNTVVNPASGFDNQAGFGFDNSSGQVEIANTNNATVLTLGKNQGTDGDFITFRKESAVVGQIGSAGGQIYLDGASGDIGLYMGTNNLYPRKSGANANNAVDIGQSNYKFKDLYLSGTVLTDVGVKVASHPVVGYSSITGGYAARFGSTGTSTLNETYIYAGGNFVSTFTSTGSVGIGAASPTGRTEIKDDGSSNDRLLYLNASSGVGGGQSGAFYGVYAHIVPNNSSTSSTAGYFKTQMQTGQHTYGIWSETSSISSTLDTIGVFGKSVVASGSTNHTSNRAIGSGPAAGGYFLAEVTGTGSLAQTTAVHAKNASAYGSEAYGLFVETTAGPTSITPIRVDHAGSTIFSVTSNTKVGIGTGAAQHSLSIGKSNAFIHLGYSGIAANTEVGRISSNTYDVNNSAYSLAEMSFLTSTANGYTGGIQFRTNGTNSTNTRASIRMTIDSTGKIGIGGTPATAQLDILSSVSGKYLYMDDGTNVLWSIQADGTTAGIIQTQGTGWSSWKPMDLRANYFMFKPNNSEIMRIDSTGVGIGTNAAPDTKLTIKGTSHESINIRAGDGYNATLAFSDPTGNWYESYVRYHTATNDMSFAVNGSERMRIVSSGIVYITSGADPIVPTIVHSGEVGNLAKLRVINRSGQGINKGGLLELGGVTDDGVSRSDVFGSIAGLKTSSTSGNREGYLQFSTSSGSALTERMRIDSTGVGIGATVPADNLHLNESGATSSFIRFSNSNVSNGWSLGAHSGGRFQLTQNGVADRLVVDSSGNVGIGVAPDTFSSGYTALQLNGYAYLIGHSGGDHYMTNNAYFNSGWKYGQTGTAQKVELASGRISLMTAASGSADAAITWNTGLVQDSTGNIGIGTTGYGTYHTSNRVLSLGSGSTIRGAISGGDPYITIASNAFHDASSWKYIHSDYASFYEQYNGTHVFSTASSGTAGNAVSFSERFRIQDSGGAYFQNTSLGIGSAPSYPLDVNVGGEIQLRVVGSGAGYCQGSIVISGGTDNTPSSRGQGIFLHNGGHDVTWYMGSPYTDGDRFVINRQASTSSPSNQAAYIHATAATNFLTIENTGEATFSGQVYTDKLDIRTTHTSTDVTAANTNSTLIVGNTGTGNGVYNAIKFAGNQQDMYMMSINHGTQASRRIGFFVGSVAGDAVADERLSIMGDGSVQARRTRSNTAGEVALSLQPTDSILHYGFRIDQATNSFNLDRVDTAGQLLRVDVSGNATFSGSATINGNLSLAPAANTPYIMGGLVSTVFRNNANSASNITILDNGNTTFAGTITSGSITTTGTINTTGAGVSKWYQATNSGNPEWYLGASDTNRHMIQTVYHSGAQTLSYVTFRSESSHGGPDAGMFRFDVDGGNTKLQIDDGGIEVTGSGIFSDNVTAFSDERLKDNIQTLDGKKVLEMRGVSYERDGVDGSGVIAQELESVAPELVHTADDGMGTKSVAYGNLVGYLIEAVKTQQKQIEELSSKIKKLEK